MANATIRSCLPSPKALRRRTFARSRPISRPRVGLHKAQPLRPHRRPRASPSASHAISRIFSGPPAPRLAGLSYEYLVTSMHSFATNERTNNGDMPKFMQMLTDSERDAIARYLSDL